MFQKKKPLFIHIFFHSISIFSSENKDLLLSISYGNETEKIQKDINLSMNTMYYLNKYE